MVQVYQANQDRLAPEYGMATAKDVNFKALRIPNGTNDCRFISLIQYLHYCCDPRYLEHFDFRRVALKDSYVNAKPLQEFANMCKKAFPYHAGVQLIVRQLSKLYDLPLPDPFFKIAIMQQDSILTQKSGDPRVDKLYEVYEYVATSEEIEKLPDIYHFVVSRDGLHIIFRHDDFYMDGAHVIFRAG